jgi:hypothetical protein
MMSDGMLGASEGAGSTTGGFLLLLLLELEEAGLNLMSC